MNRLLAAGLTVSVLLVPVAARGQAPSALLDQGVRAYAVREYDGGAWMLRRALSVEGQGALSQGETARALLYLTAIEVAHNQRDSALAAARRLIVLDLARVGVGEAYLSADGAWRRRVAGQPAPVPDYCR